MSRVLFVNARLARMTSGGAAYGLVDDGTLAVEGGRIVHAGSRATCPAHALGWRAVDLGGRLVTPAPIDCHTHLVFAGDRADEFERRLNGASYEEIARAGGGILSTVAATRAADEEALLVAALPRVDGLIAEGVGTLEIKSGYGLDRGSELAMLRVARRVGEVRDVRVRTSYLGAHAVPPEYAGRSRDYLDEIVLPTLEAAHAEGLVDAVDGFCETIAFSPAEIDALFERARALGLPVKLHAEQLSDSGGVALAARHGALSADHLESLSDEGIAAMARAGTVATLLPGAFYALRETRRPPVEALRAAGVPIAVATDLNPGSSPLGSILAAMNMACTLFGLTPEEALAGVTREAARALGLGDELGTLEPGRVADLAVWDASTPAALSWGIGLNPLHRRIVGGRA